MSLVVVACSIALLVEGEQWWWLVGVGSLVVWLFERRVGVRWSEDRIVVQNRIRRHEFAGKDVEYVEGAIRGWRGCPHVVLKGGRRIALAGFVPLIPLWGDESVCAIDLARALDLPYRKG